MTLRHINEKWYVIGVDHTRDSGVAPWRHRGYWLHGPNSEAHIEWNVFGSGFGWGFQFGRNGGESDIGLNLYAGRLASVWLRLRAPWTKWARVSKEKDPKGWYNARHTGLRIHPHDGCFIAGEFDAYDGMWSSKDPWWRQWSITKTTILGRQRSETIDGATGVASVPLPEGPYISTWQEKTYINRYVRWPGTWRDRLLGARQHRSINLEIDGGIPVEGKGENSWDVGMDGVFGVSGSTLADAIANAVRSVARDRDRYGGPHDLPHPMTVKEAEERHAV